jgi:hypothetical protein
MKAGAGGDMTIRVGEWGYANRIVELARKVGQSLR